MPAYHSVWCKNDGSYPASLLQRNENEGPAKQEAYSPQSTVRKQEVSRRWTNSCLLEDRSVNPSFCIGAVIKDKIPLGAADVAGEGICLHRFSLGICPV